MVKNAMLFPKLIYRLNVTPIKNSDFFVDIYKLFLSFIWKCKEPRTATTTLKQKNKIGDLTPSDFTTYFKPTIIMTV